MSNAPGLAYSRRLRRTPFTSRVIKQGVKAFTVYNHMLLPTEFKSLEEDYWHLCSRVQVWDVGVERQVSIKGPDASRLVQWMTPRDIANVALDRCVYLPLADEDGKLINDPVGIRVDEEHWWLSVADSDVILWAKGLARGAKLDVQVDEPDVWPLAVQGPMADTLMARLFGDAVHDIRFFRYARLKFQGHPFIVARSGWSKQGGFEVYVDDVDVGRALYDELFLQGEDLLVRPGCPNLIERLESGLLAFGNDMDSRHSVLESGLGAFINLDADIDAISLPALRAERAEGLVRRLVGLAIPAPDGARPIDAHFLGRSGHAESDVVMLNNDISSSSLGSQCWSPRYRHQLATAMMNEPEASQEQVMVTLEDGTEVLAKVCELPFDFSQLGITPSV